MQQNLKPNKTRLRLWVKWLLDPSHQQTKHVLSTGRKYCCLGGACEVYKTETGRGAWERKHGHLYFSDGGSGFDNMYYDIMPEGVHEWFGLEDPNPRLIIKGLNGQGCSDIAAADLNDEEEWSFAQIAEAITRTFKLDRKTAKKATKKGKK